MIELYIKYINIYTKYLENCREESQLNERGRAAISRLKRKIEGHGEGGDGVVETLKEAAQRCNIEPCRSISQEGFHIRMPGARILDLYLRKVEDSYKGRGGGGGGGGWARE